MNPGESGGTGNTGRTPGPVFSGVSAGLIAAAWFLLIWLNWCRVNYASGSHEWMHGIAQTFYELSCIRPAGAARAWVGHLALIGLAAVMVFAAWGAGRRVIRWIGAYSRATTWFAAPAVGAGMAAFAVLGMGFAGLAFPSVGWTGLAVGLLCVDRLPRRNSLAWMRRPVNAAALAVIAAALLVALVGALAPSVGFDAETHHLAHPQIFRGAHKVIPLPHHFLSYFPALLEMQYLLAYLLSGGPQLAKLVNYSWGVYAVIVLVFWARRTMEARWALAAGVLFVLFPYVQALMMIAYVDSGEAGYFILMSMALCSGPVNPVFIGLLCGLCAGVKVTGMFAPVIAAIVFAAGKKPAKDWLLLGAAFLVVAVPWAGRNYLLSGNPFAPFFADYLPTLWWGSDNMARYKSELEGYLRFREFPLGIGKYLYIPWDISVNNAAVLDPESGIGGWMLWGIPLLLVLSCRDAMLPGLIVSVFCLLWMMIPMQARYLTPVCSVAALACASIARELSGRGAIGRMCVWGMGAVLAFQFLVSLSRQHALVNPVPVVFGIEDRDHYIARGRQGGWAGIRMQKWLGANGGQGNVLMINPHAYGRLDGSRAVFQSAMDTPLIQRYSLESRTPGEIRKRFRQDGIAMTVYRPEIGMEIQRQYRPFEFNGGSGERWRAFWTAYADRAANFDDRVLVHRLMDAPAVAPMRGDESVLPGLDEQWLCEASHLDEITGRSAPDIAALRAVAGRYRDIAVKTGSADAYERWGAVLLRMGEADQGFAVFREALKRGRKSAVCYAVLGVSEGSRNRMDRAVDYLRQSIELDPGLASARCNLVKALLRVRRNDEAIRVLTDGLRLDPVQPQLNELRRELLGARSAQSGP